jgi:hypothetical protein
MDSCDTLEERIEYGSSKRRKTLYIIKDRNPSIKCTRPKRAQEDTTQREKKTNNEQK